VNIEATAVKCKNCLEFLPDFKKSEAKSAKILSEPLLGHLFGLFGKMLVPLTVLILVLTYKPTLDLLLIRTKEAEFLGTKISFNETKAYAGTLTPLELYYLIESAVNFSHEDIPRSTLNYDSIKSKKHDDIIQSLSNKGLLTYKIKENPEGKFFTKEIVLIPTEKGKNFLIELGMSFNGSEFSEAP
jgi:hypothetical protein